MSTTKNNNENGHQENKDEELANMDGLGMDDKKNGHQDYKNDDTSENGNQDAIHGSNGT